MPVDETIAAEKTASPEATTSRRRALGLMGTTVAAAAAMPALDARADIGKPLVVTTPPPALAPHSELVDLLEYEDQARLVAGPAKVALVTGSDRTVTDRMTLRPRINILTKDMDLSCPLFGDQHFTPILIGPVADQKRFHSDGEVATARGASAAKAGMVVSSDSSVPLSEIAQATTSPLWVQVTAGSPKVKKVLAEAEGAKAKAVVVTVNAGTGAAKIDWAAVEAVVKGTSLPVVVKGITTPQEAKDAVAHGAKGVIISNWRGGSGAALKGTLLLVRPVVDAVGGQVPVLVDGSFRYGSDVLKALGLGAKAVLIARPVMWGLMAYGADGVQAVVEHLQTDLSRFMAMTGRANLAAIEPSLVRVHGPLPKVTQL